LADQYGFLHPDGYTHGSRFRCDTVDLRTPPALFSKKLGYFMWKLFFAHGSFFMSTTAPSFSALMPLTQSYLLYLYSYLPPLFSVR
jgi:hypothetical protein